MCGQLNFLIWLAELEEIIYVCKYVSHKIAVFPKLFQYFKSHFNKE